MTTAGDFTLQPLPSDRRREVVQRASRAFGVAVLPAALAALAVRYLVPMTGSGLRGVVAVVGQRYTLLFGIALYFAFSGVARYWRGRLAAPRDAWLRDAVLFEQLRRARLRGELGSAGDDVRAGELDARLVELRGALETRDPRRVEQARGRVESLAAPFLERRRRREMLSFVALVVGAVALSYGFRSLVARPYRVLSASMLPTLEPADLVAARVRPYPSGGLPRRGDVVVFRADAVALGPNGPGLADVLVKRVIGLPGDRIEMHGDTPVINGWVVPSCDAGEYFYALPTFGDPGLNGRLHVEFLDGRVYLAVYAVGGPPFEGPYVVKPGEVFVLGDNRANSLDSRAYNANRGGGVPLDAVEARAVWFLTGTHRSGDTDFGRLLKSIDALQTRLRIESLDTRALDEGIARCLKDPPRDTRPPSP